MEEILARIAQWAGLLAETAAVLVVAFGSAEAFGKLIWLGTAPRTTHGVRKEIWRRYGMWLLLGLEFELAADIVGSIVSPSWQDIGELGAIAVIRTFLNYFLEKDLEHAEASGELLVAASPATASTRFAPDPQRSGERAPRRS